MNWSRLASNPEFRELYEDDGLVGKEIQRIVSALTKLDGVTDPYKIGDMRGRLAALRWLRKIVNEKARQQESDVQDEANGKPSFRSRVENIFNPEIR